MTNDTSTEVDLPRVASTPREFVDWLAGFTTSTELARWLGDHGVTGRLANGKDCPLARLAKHGLDRQDVGVTGRHLVSLSEVEENGIQDNLAALPWVAQEFVARFDLGQFPELRDPGTPFRPQCPCPLCTGAVAMPSVESPVWGPSFDTNPYVAPTEGYVFTPLSLPSGFSILKGIPA